MKEGFEFDTFDHSEVYLSKSLWQVMVSEFDQGNVNTSTFLFNCKIYIYAK